MNIVIFFTGFSNDYTISGGLKRLINILNIWDSQKIIIGGNLKNNHLKDKCENKVDWIYLKFPYIKNRLFSNIICFTIGSILYIPLLIFYIRYKSNGKRNILIPESHFMSEIFPLLIYKLLFPRSKLIIYVQLLIHFYRKDRSLTDKFSILNEKIGLYMSRYADRIFTINEFDRDILIKSFKIHSSNIAITTNTLTEKELHLIDTTCIYSKIYDTIFMSRIHKEKGIFDLIEIIKMIKSKKSDIKCVVIGNGPDKEIFIKRIEEEMLIDNILYLGYVDEEEKIKLLKSSKVFIYPTYADSFSLTLLEVLKCGLPIIAYGIPSVESTGMYKNKIDFIKKGDIEEFTRKLYTTLINDENEKTIEIGKSIKLKNWKEIANEEWEKI